MNLKSSRKSFLLTFIALLLLYTPISAKLLHREQTLEDQKFAYFQALNNEQTQLKLALNNINKEIEYLHTTMDQVKSIPPMKIVALEQALAEQRDILYTIQQDHQLPLNLKVTECNPLTAQELSSINQAVTNVQNQLNTVLGQILVMKSNDPKCSICKQLQKEYDWAKVYLDHIKQIQASSCPNPGKSNVIPNGTIPVNINEIDNVADYENIPNLAAENWVYGQGFSPQEYNLKLFEFMTKYNVTKCPLTTPFIQKNTENCTVCPKETPIFSLSQEACIACPEDKVYNAQSHSCGQSAGFVNGTAGNLNNGQTSCSNGRYYDFNLEKCICPKQTPFYSSERCVSCLLPKYFNENTKTCDSCPQFTAYNTEKKECLPCPENAPAFVNGICTSCGAKQYFDYTSKTCVSCPGGKQYNSESKTCQCPQIYPYFNNKKCFRCQLPSFYDADSNTCINCQENLFFNSESKKCESCPAQTPLSNGVTCTKCPEPKFWDLNSQSCKECPIGTYFNEARKLCFRCPEGTTYNSEKHRCLKTITECPENQVLNSQKTGCVCPSTLPHFDGTNCVTCDENLAWDQNKKICAQCPLNTFLQNGECVACPEGSSYNKQTKKCEAHNCQGNQAYNFENEKCECPSNLPFWNEGKCNSCLTNQFFDKEKNACVKCSSEHPIFNGKQCISCPADFKFNQTTGVCEGNQIACSQNYIFNDESNQCECPENAPYDDSNRCVSCELPNFWNQDDKSCVSCGENQFFDTKSEKCLQCPDDHPYFNSETLKCSKIQGSCPQSYVYNSESDSCTCPTLSPFDDGKTCQKCYLPNFWNLKTQKCESCPTGQYYSIDQLKCAYCPRSTPLFNGKKCVSCPAGYVYYETKRTCVKPAVQCKSNFIYNPATEACVCPGQTPFNQGQKCVACGVPNFWSEQETACKSCPEGSTFDYHENKCINKNQANGTNVSNDNNIQTNGTVITNGAIPSVRVKCNPTYLWDQNKNVCYCSNRTFDDGTKCVTCYLPNYWNHQNKKCESCPVNQLYNTKSKKCEYCPKETPIISEFKCVACPQNSVFVESSRKCVSYTETCPETYTYSPEEKKCVCPKAQPFNTGSKCVACYLPNYWNHDSNTCQSCPEYQTYNINSRKCEYCPQTAPLLDGYKCVACPKDTIFVKESRKCISYQQYCPKTYVYSPEKGKCVCPKTAPFNDGEKCVACYLPKYWDHDKNSCESCPEFQIYNTQLKKCAYCPDQTPFLNGYKCSICPQGTIFVKQSRKCISYSLYCPETYVYDKQKNKCVCPKTNPFNDGKKCVSCYLPNYWNHDTKSCESCPEFKYYNIQSKACEYCPGQTPFLDNYKCIACPAQTLFVEKSRTCVSYSQYCPKTYVYSEEKKKCVCPKTSPFNDGQKCVACYLPSYWNHDNNKCEKCPEFQFYNTELKKCAYCPETTPLLDSDGLTCLKCPEQTIFVKEKRLCVSYSEYCPATFEYSKEKGKCVCPKKTPFNNGKTCVSCYLPKYWNHDSNSCESCPAFQRYNTQTKRCEVCPEATPVLSNNGLCEACPEKTIYNAESHICVTFDSLCPNTYSYDKLLKKCVCPKETPFNTGQICVSCYLPKYWNHDTNSCDACPEYKYYNTQEKRCMSCSADKPFLNSYTCEACPVGTAFKAETRTCVSYALYCPESFTYNKDTGKCVCGSKAPFFNGEKCVSCYLPQYWDHNTRECKSCPDLKFYDVNVKQCVYCPNENPRLVDGKCYACLENTYFIADQHKCLANEDICPATRVYDPVNKSCKCPKTAPFFDGSNCVACYLPKYWNHDTLRCEDCQDGFKYDTNLKKCIKKA